MTMRTNGTVLEEDTTSDMHQPSVSRSSEWHPTILSIAIVIVLVSVSFSGCVEEKMNNEPVAVFACGDIVQVNTVVDFNASDSYDTDNDAVTYSWDFGDGLGSNSIILNAIAPTAVHTYYKIGDYNVKLTVSDGKYSSETSKSIKVVYGSNKKPIALTDGSKYANAEVGVNDNIKDEVRANLSFDGTNSYDEDGTIISYDWDFDASDGFTVDAKGMKASNNFSSGAHKVTLRVTDDFWESGRTNAWAVVNYSCSYFGLLTNQTPTPNTQYPNLPLPNIPQIPNIPTQPPSTPPSIPNQNPDVFNANFSAHSYGESVVVNLSFRSSIENQQTQTGNINNIDLYVYDGTGTLVEKSETPLNVNATSNQTEEVRITAENINATSIGTWVAQIKCTSGINVEYTLTMYVKYSIPAAKT